MLERMESLGRLAAVETGKRFSACRDEVALSAAILQYYADHAERFLGPQVIDTTMGDAHLEFSPLGVLIPTSTVSALTTLANVSLNWAASNRS
jgi:succinate-semialdehyde dehydrogenase/glutarate-semialdehyde dehydrogenase